MKNVDAYVLSNIGNVRENHEDNFYIPNDKFIDEKKQKEIKSKDAIVEYGYTSNKGIFAVCDGMGGHNAGEVASRIAVETISKKYNELLVDDKDKLMKFIKDLNNSVCEYSDKNLDCSNMGTTFSGLIVFDNRMYMLHVGDSRIYKFKNNILSQISSDHTEGTRLVKAGIIKESDLSKFPNRKLLYKYIGRKGELIADCEKIDDIDDTRFIIASDGLSDTLKKDEILETISESKEPKDVCHNLLAKCLEKGNECSDNVTIICIDTN